MTTAEQHTRQFHEFVEYELATGGPDPHARYVGVLSFPQGWREIVWRGGLYSAIYTSPSAEAVWRAWPYERVARSEQGVLFEWLKTHRAGIPLRRERMRPVGSVEKLARCLWSYHQWMEYQLPPLLQNLPADPYVAYDFLWTAADKALYGFGRYALTKLLDFYEQYCDIDISMPDIRPVDGWSPRETLALLYPGWPSISPRENTSRAIEATNQCALSAKNDLFKRGLDLDWFRFEVMLCEYKQSAVRERQYPGRSIDSELKYLAIVEPYWNKAYVNGDTPVEYQSEIWQVRQNMHPHESLGEINGWDGVRDELGGFLNATGDTWSDLLYEFDKGGDTIRRRSGDGRNRIRTLAVKQLNVTTTRSSTETLV